MNTTCKYCNEPENKQVRPGLTCATCNRFVHLQCLRSRVTPGNFACDVFFDFLCQDCSPNKEEVLIRTKMPWVNVLLLTLNHLGINMQGISNHGFFHYKTHIGTFIDSNWEQLFGPLCKKKKNLIGTIAGVLSKYSNMFFRSGCIVLGESGWWKLMHSFSPAAAAHINQEMTRGQREALSVDMTVFFAKVTMLGYKDYIKYVAEIPINPIAKSGARKRPRHHKDEPKASTSNAHELFHPEKLQPSVAFSENASCSQPCDMEWEPSVEEATSLLTYVTIDNNDMETMTSGFTCAAPDVETMTSGFTCAAPDVETMTSGFTCAAPDVETMTSGFTFAAPDVQPFEDKRQVDRPQKSDEPAFPTHSLFSSKPNTTRMPWMDEEDEPMDEPKEKGNLVELTPYEEMELLEKVKKQLLKVKEPNKKAELHRLKAKLALRKLKRDRNLPQFDLDKIVKKLGGYENVDPRVVTNANRVLDRFQKPYLVGNLCSTIARAMCGTLLLSQIEPKYIRSAYSGITLKPFIRRDSTSTSTWLKVMDELLRVTHRDIKDYSPPPRGTIDYSYVRPQHIAAVNSLCEQFFWPGIDLTEALEYPEFSCVVTYKRVVVACAFLVPDSGHNEAYISYVLTRPEWRRAQIASFMLYHLLQTCLGKDVTLHCSPANPAIFLYQKFGFKVEEMIQGFYEKYYDMDYKGCRHAVFMRLTR